MEPIPNRRQVLAAVGSIAASGGCLWKDEPPLGLTKITLLNFSQQPVDVTVRVQKGGKPVYNESHSLGTSYGEMATQFEKDWMGERALYEITISTTVDGTHLEASSDSYALVGNRDEYGSACFFLSATIRSDTIDIAHGFKNTCSLTTETTTQ